MKWWPGALARTANFGVVYARLLLGGKDYGVHNFMVQLRDLETHDAMPGVTLGDVGPKIGFNNVDNGYCRFNRVRIPRQNMGMRFATVSREGKYVKNSGVPQEVLYFTMLQTRMVFIRSAGINLAKACTITIRYSAVRQQGYDANNPKSKEELSVLDYQTQQYRLFPLLAAAYAIVLTALLKILASYKKSGNVPEPMAFLANIDKLPSVAPRTKQQWLDPQSYVAAFEHRFLYQLRSYVKKISAETSVTAGLQNNSMDTLKLTNSYASLVIVKTFAEAVQAPSTLTSEFLSSPVVLNVVRLLCHLFALTQLEATAGEFMESGCVFPNEMPIIRANIEELLALIRPHAVTLVDGFNFSDHTLNSTLGRYDGNVYEALYESAQHDPLNHSSDKVALHELLRPIRDEISQSRLNVEKLEWLEQLLVQDPVFNHEKMNYLTRGEQYKRATQMAGRAEIIAHRNKLSEEDTALLHVVLQNVTSCPSSTALHTGMFFKNLGLLFTDEQQARWMKMAKQWRMIGCYAQTELGHGSNVRGLETTATYIPATDEFEIHSPTLTSMKWWPGALARTANFGVVYARLLLGGKDYGVHNFMVQLRDLETHDAMPGVTLGDVGPKIGFNNVDNGYCRASM
ncbi:unnamed protein product [Phytophthora fragariaefolia]|uniref:Unnamed protein product n=1 Tax=Phytophthora fragariaefolia TaxID=1490495 RepID=A0A9W6YG51_9STRA|nr:unnamed protein product [Phytophthora fragariaefolia]